MTFGEKLKSIRKEKGYSQEEMAGLLDVSRQAVSNGKATGEYRRSINYCRSAICLV